MADEPSFLIRFALAALATWRVTHLLASEDGPADLVARLRAQLGNSFVGKMMDCFDCLSLWVAIPTAFSVSRQPSVLLLSWLALSGAAILLERLKSEPLMIERTQDSEHRETSNGVLWSEEINVGRPSSAANSTDG